MTDRPVTRKSAALFVLLASLAFAVSGPLARYARPVHPVFIAFGRVALASIVLAAIDVRGLQRAAARLSPRQRRTVFAAGVVLAAHFALFLAGLDLTSLPAALSLISLEPLGVILCAWLVFGIRPNRAEQIGALLAASGAFVVARGAGAGEHRLVGDLLVLGAVALYGVYVAIARALRDALPARAYACLVYGSAAVSLAAALPLVPGALSGVTPPPAHSALAIAAIALIPTIGGHTAVQVAARRMSPTIVSLASPGETLGGIVVGAAWLGAVPTATEIVGAAIILVGCTLAILGSSRREAPSSA